MTPRGETHDEGGRGVAAGTGRGSGLGAALPRWDENAPRCHARRKEARRPRTVRGVVAWSDGVPAVHVPIALGVGHGAPLRRPGAEEARVLRISSSRIIRPQRSWRAGSAEVRARGDLHGLDSHFRGLLGVASMATCGDRFCCQPQFYQPSPLRSRSTNRSAPQSTDKSIGPSGPWGYELASVRPGPMAPMWLGR